MNGRAGKRQHKDAADGLEGDKKQDGGDLDDNVDAEEEGEAVFAARDGCRPVLELMRI